MRKIVVTVVGLTMMASAAPALAGHRPNSYCSESGDVCASAKREDGVMKLKISLAAKYFDRYKLCVTAPDDSKTCKEFRIEKQGGVFGDTVRWRRHFPDEGPGAYTVRWSDGKGFRSKRLGFHISG